MAPPAQGIGALRLSGDARRVALSTRRIDGQPFGEALRAEVRQVGGASWSVQLLARTTAPIERGDVLLATFYLRGEVVPACDGPARTELVFEQVAEPWRASTKFPICADAAWQPVHVRFTAVDSYAAGDAQLSFRLGFAVQTVEIGAVTLQNFGRGVTLDALPTTPLHYPGMAPDEPWRAGAATRSEQLRKAVLRVVVHAADGRRLAGVPVRATLTRPAFGLGSCVRAALLDDPAQAAYQRTIGELFTVATLENELKWPALTGDWGAEFSLERAQRGAAWLRARGVAVRGHALVWPRWSALPRALRAHADDAVRLRREINRHVRELVGAMRGQVAQWDVLNEPVDNQAFLDGLGRAAIVDWFAEARAADPAARLFVNEHSILSGGGGRTAHRDAFERLLEFLVARDTPFDGIGLQGHCSSALTGPEDLLALLDRFARFGKRIVVTEYDIAIDDEAMAARYTADFYAALFSHPAVDGIVMWGFCDASHWRRNAPMYRHDFSLKPAGQVIRDLALRAWRSEASGVTDVDGSFATRAFLGDYALRAGAGDDVVETSASLARDGTVVAIRLARA